ncbi:MAG: 50S ribosomal protein L10 [Ignavibacterium sp.]|nr:50S ribosomal protein L10 [Ignavibacterium sp.]MCX7610833.1 50S ribosomal protein L10 [Ignavibacterium sp.]MDW8374835.1 50S ribosomal protein L10 [Ignavibacteriales bacterium]
MKKHEKTEIINEVKKLIEESNAVYVADYSGINVAEITDLRNQFRKEGVKYKVFKNTLFKIAINESGKYPKLAENLVGMSGFAFAMKDPTAPARIIKKFNETNKKFTLKACYIETEYFTGDQLEALANLPTKADIVAGIISSINAPASGIVGSINAVFRDLISVIDQISKKAA